MPIHTYIHHRSSTSYRKTARPMHVCTINFSVFVSLHQLDSQHYRCEGHWWSRTPGQRHNNGGGGRDSAIHNVCCANKMIWIKENWIEGQIDSIWLATKDTFPQSRTLDLHKESREGIFQTERLTRFVIMSKGKIKTTRDAILEPSSSNWQK